MDLGYAEIATCPAFFFDDRYSRLPSRYLRERSSGDWEHQLFHSERAPEVLSPQSQRNCGYHLKNFLEYCSALHLDPSKMNYKHVIRYQNDMAEGRWSAKGRNLAPSTANIRADEATSYLAWLPARRHRMKFKVSVRYKRSTFSRFGRPQIIPTRAQRKTERQTGLQVLQLPEQPMVDDWLINVRHKRGESKMYNARLVVETGLRLTESCSLIVSQWPTRSEIEKAEQRRQEFVNLTVTITKGSKPRVVLVTVEFAKLVTFWIEQKDPDSWTYIAAGQATCSRKPICFRRRRF